MQLCSLCSNKIFVEGQVSLWTTQLAVGVRDTKSYGWKCATLLNITAGISL